MDMGVGRLDAAHELMGYHDKDGVTDLAYALARYLFVHKVLQRQRNSVQFVRALERHMKSPEEGRPDEQPPAA